MKRTINSPFTPICVFFVCFFLLSGCRHVQYVAVPETHEVYIDRLIQDTTYVDRTHTEVLMGDTLFIHDSVNRYHAVILHDSVAVHDSVLDADLLASLKKQAEDKAATYEATISSLRTRLTTYIILIVLLVLGIAYYIYTLWHKKHSV